MEEVLIRMVSGSPGTYCAADTGIFSVETENQADTQDVEVS